MLKQLYRQRWPYVANRSRALRAGITLKLADLNGSGSRASYMKQYEFEQAARQKAQLAAADSQTIETIRDEILAKSHDLGLWVARGYCDRFVQKGCANTNRGRRGHRHK
jgi:hypothetical protein